uniref:Transposase n=1 Tax=Legionella sainthelensi TaxID=28087 RepID=A0A2H5FM22_9GAMM
MSKKQNYYTASKKSKIVIAAIEGKLTQAQLTSEYGVPPTQIKAWKQTALQAIADAFSNVRDKDKKRETELVDALSEEIGRPQTQLS